MSLFLRSCHSLFDLAIKRVSSLLLLGWRGCALLPSGLVMLLAASFQSLPVGSSPGNSGSPPIHWHADGEAMSPQSAHLAQETGWSCQRGRWKVRTVSTLQPGCLGSSVISARLNHLPGYLPPVFPGRMGTQGQSCAESGREAAEHTRWPLSGGARHRGGGTAARLATPTFP